MTSDDLERLSDPTDIARRSEEAFLEDSLALARSRMTAQAKPRGDGLCLNPNCGDDLPKGRDRFCNKSCATEFEHLNNSASRLYGR